MPQSCSVYIYLYIQTVMNTTILQSVAIHNIQLHLIFIGSSIIVIFEDKRSIWCHLPFWFHFLCAQHVSDINISIIRNLRLFCWITTLVECSSRIRAGWSLQHWYHPNPTTRKHQHTSNQEHTTNVVIQQHSRKLLMMAILISETCWAHKKWNKNNKWHQVGLLFSTIKLHVSAQYVGHHQVVQRTY